MDPSTPPSPPAVPPGTPTPCPSCGAAGTDPYCGACGNRRLPEGPPTLRRLLRDGLRSALSLDSALWRSFRTLFLRPGRLTAGYMEGRRAGVLGPIQLFLTANLIYFVVQPYTGFSGYNTPLQSHVSRQVYSEALDIRGRVLGAIDARADRALADELEALGDAGTSLSAADSLQLRDRVEAVQEAVYVTRFDARAEVFARSLVIFIVPVFALALWLLHAGSGRSGVRHVVLALHLQAWNLAFIGSIFLLALGLLARASVAVVDASPEGLLARLLTDPRVAGILSRFMEQGSVLVIAPYYYLALRTAYGDTRVGAALRAVALVVVTFGAILAYRLLLFWTTWLTL